MKLLIRLLYISSMAILCLNLYPITTTVIGTGYVGLVTGACLSDLGHRVICVDIDSNKIKMLNEDIIPIHENGLEKLVTRNKKSKNLFFTTDIKDAIESAEVIIIAVGTPMNSDHSPNLSYLAEVVHNIAAYINTYKIILTKSTVPIGTGSWIQSYLQECGVSEKKFDVVSNPEFLREGTAIYDFLNADRIVVGAESERAKEMMLSLYAPLIKKGTQVVCTNLITAETIKYASNAFLSCKLGFINELSNLCEETNADIKVIAHAMGLDQRISPKYLNPGPGFGGSCLVKDCHALLHTAKNHNIDLKIISACLKSNETQTQRPALQVEKHLGNVQNKIIAVLGLTYKAGTDDVRTSPAIKTIQYLKKRGALIRAYDPVAINNMKMLIPDITYCQSLDEAIDNANAIVIMTEWDEFKNLTLSYLEKIAPNGIIVDSRHIINKNLITKYNQNKINQ